MKSLLNLYVQSSMLLVAFADSCSRILGFRYSFCFLIIIIVVGVVFILMMVIDSIEDVDGKDVLEGVNKYKSC